MEKKEIKNSVIVKKVARKGWNANTEEEYVITPEIEFECTKDVAEVFKAEDDTAEESFKTINGSSKKYKRKYENLGKAFEVEIDGIRHVGTEKQIDNLINKISKSEESKTKEKDTVI